MSNDSNEYRSVADRQKSGQSRVHSELTDKARERTTYISLNPRRMIIGSKGKACTVPESVVYRAVNKTAEDVGSTVREHVSEGRTYLYTHEEIITKADTLDVLAYLENLLNILYQSSANTWRLSDVPSPSSKDGPIIDKIQKEVTNTGEKINTVLETEGILWRLDFEDKQFRFIPIGSELMEDADSELSIVAQDKKWSTVISPYNSAYDLYKDRRYGYEIPEKLYNSIEELGRVICVDLEDWEDNRELNLSEYLDTMRENAVFQPNNIMYAEIEDLTNSMEKAFQKAGAERKNRHQEVGREYCTLMLHQVSAYLTYIIRNYESTISST